MGIPISQFIEMFGDPVDNPKGFEKYPLMKLAKKITDGVHKKPVYTKTGIPFISVTNINRGVIDFTDCKFVSEEAYQVMIKTTYPERGDVLYTKVGATYGISAYVDTDKQFGLYVSVCLIKPKHDLIDAQFLTESMRMEYVKKQADERIKGIGVPDLHLREIKSFEILCPPRELQEQFVEFVKQSDKSKFACLKSQFIEMFGDPVLNSRQHTVRKLADLGELNRGVSKARPRNTPDLLGGPYPLIQTGEVAAAQLYIDSYENTYSEKGLAQSRMWPKGTLCITIAANIAQTAILAIDACFPDSVVGFIPGDEVTQIYMHYWFSFFQKILDEQAPQVAQKNINLKILSNLDVMVPPLELQKKFEDFVKQSDKSKLCFHLHTTALYYTHS